MEPEPLRHYIIEEKGPPPHQHSYEYTSGGEYVVRHCECGQSWVMVVLENIIDRSLTYRWREIEEEETSVEP